MNAKKDASYFEVRRFVDGKAFKVGCCISFAALAFTGLCGYLYYRYSQTERKSKSLMSRFRNYFEPEELEMIKLRKLGLLPPTRQDLERIKLMKEE